ncbi:Ribosomal RNA small subunit methyltransferase G [Firmicutes bacterium ASF500]|nr:Ribosomal RNA small subunit methyltransferase G [Firmicutes bacterium ASF500]
MEEIISAGLKELGLTGRVPEDAPAQLAQYGRMLLEKNQVMNLTAIREPEGVARMHFLDCAALLKYCDFQGKTLIDVGTGAGFPGMVLKILVPSLKITLLDSLSKRLDWLTKVYEKLDGVDSIAAFHGRAEEFGLNKRFRDSFDFATARAVADLRVLCELCLPFIKAGGKFLAMKSTNSDEELSQAAHAIKLLGGRVSAVEDYTIPGTEVTHRLIVIEKLAPTLKGYPRRWAKIQSAPL